MATITKLLSPVHPSGNIRPFDLQRDLRRVADLVELCFTDTLDPDGQNYLRQMRAMARNPRYLKWTQRVSGRVSLPLSGYVWEEDGQLAGNLTLIPHISMRHRYYLIANVSVHPDYRRRGIARSLTGVAVEHARRRGAQSAWLQVRAENLGAYELYRSQGFSERARRTTWQSQPRAGLGDLLYSEAAAAASGIQIGRRRAGDWAFQRAWMERYYPPALSWHFPLKPHSLRPGVLGFLARVFNDLRIQQWAARREGRLLGVVAWQGSLGYADHLWLAPDPAFEEIAVGVLLRAARRHRTPRRVLSLNFPAGRAGETIRAAGFQEHQTLVWMELGL